MTMPQNYSVILALLIINKGEPLNNSYQIIRILEREFGIIESKIALDEIKDKGYATYQILGGVHYYSITLLGRNLVSAQYDRICGDILRAFPNSKSMILSLFNSFSSNE